MHNNSCFIFDLDGTLSEPRKPVVLDFKSLFLKAKRLGAEVCILTGSDIVYVIEQAKDLLDIEGVRIFCCNGTKEYVYNNGSAFLKTEKSIAETYGNNALRSIYKILLELQLDFLNIYDNISGSFIDYRGSMINWSPSGRSYISGDQRDAFVAFDKSISYRDNIIKKLNKLFEETDGLDQFVVKLGGDTSFDIHPVGWDKSCILELFADKNAYFWGDRCFQSGNDYDIYKKIKKTNRFAVKNPTDAFNSFKLILEMK